jgi:MFS family permease
MQSPPSIETRTSWIVATVATVVIAMAFGAAWIAPVALKRIAAEVDDLRSIPALAGALVWLGIGCGGILLSWLAERIGVRWTVIGGALMIGIGLALSTLGPGWPLYLGHGLFIGLLGVAGINAPLYVYLCKWFDYRRGSALALISSGAYIAGALWPPVFERAIAYFGWRQTMLLYAALQFAVIVPLAALYFGRAPEQPEVAIASGTVSAKKRVLGWPPNLIFALLAAASFLCCVPMAIPQAHLIAFCGDIGISAAHGAAMVSVLLGAAFVSRQGWGWMADRVGGLRTALVGSACQTVAMSGFLLTQDEIGLFAVAAAFGAGFSGLVPAYVLSLRELFPPAEASWRIPSLLLISGGGMAAGGWLGGVLYDRFAFYGPAFAAGIAFGMLNLAVLAVLVWKHGRASRIAAPASGSTLGSP